jgi:hypothetical protein
MRGKAFAAVTLLAVVLIAAISSAATSGPTAGDWSGKLKGVKPATALTFTVTASGRKRTVTTFQSTRAFTPPCLGAEPATVSGIPSAKVSSSGKFKAVGREDNGFGSESWTVSGTFKNKHSASGSVAIDLFLTTVKQCKFTVKWTAGEEAATPPLKGATYRGKATISAEPVTLKVSANGKELESVTWTQPLIGGSCPGIGNNAPSFTGHNVPIHGSKFSYTVHSGAITHGAGTTHTDSITGQFLSGHKASGTLSTSTDISGIGNTCQGSDTWSAHG